MRSSKSLILIVLAFWLSACANKPFTYQHGYTDANFAELKTYRWAPDNKRRPFPEVAQKLVSTSDKVLADKGFVLKPDGPVDFIMSYDITAESDIDVNRLRTYGGTGLGFTWRRDQGFNKDPLHTTGSVSVGKLVGKGTVILDAIDPDTKQVFWRGVANKEMELDTRSDSMEPLIDVAQAQRNMSVAAKNMLSLFPPEESSN